MPTIAAGDGTSIYYKDRGKGQPVLFSHGWPLSADDWWRQGMMGGIKPANDCIGALSETDFTDDLKTIDAPVLLAFIGR